MSKLRRQRFGADKSTVLRRAKVVSVTQLVIGKKLLKSNTNKSTNMSTNKNENTTRKRRLTIAASPLGIAL
jgi:hypothetical protein